MFEQGVEKICISLYTHEHTHNIFKNQQLTVISPLVRKRSVTASVDMRALVVMTARTAVKDQARLLSNIGLDNAL
jgi:hypothetical protein